MRQRLTRLFLWICVIAWGLLVGAKLFDLQVLVGAWSLAPPESLGLLPYGPQWPVDTGEFFMPSSAALLACSLGALLAGWRTPSKYRVWLAISLAMIFGVLILTVTQFWPRNAALWAYAQGKSNALGRAEVVQMVREWVRMDWIRVAVGLTGFLASIRALSVPYPGEVVRPPASLPLKVAYVAGVGTIVAFVAWFVSKV